MIDSSKVTIVMPVFNGGRHFQIALESALAQTYENLEIVVVNDGSTDGGETESIALAQRERIRYFRQENKGVAGALNTGVREMTGDFFAWLSHDDIHLPHKTASQIAFFRRLGQPDAMLFSDYELIDQDGKVICPVRLPHREFVANPSLPLLNGCINGCTLLIPTSIIKKFGPFDEGQRYTQDYDLWNKILAEHTFFHQPTILVQYRSHPNQDSHRAAAAVEGDALWIRMLDSRTPIEQAQMFGSRRRYFTSLARFLEKTPYKRAATHASEQACASLAQTTVSVVMPVGNEAPKACRAIRSVLAQTHQNLELLAVHDGSAEDMSEVTALSATDPRIRMLRQSKGGSADARNFGLSEARGEYIAFIDADSHFLPQKLQRQMGLMQQAGRLFSHTSHFVEFPERSSELGLVRSGNFGGAVYPEIIGRCPIATPTVMMHRVLVAEGFLLPSGIEVYEDVLAWIDLAAHYELLGIDEPLAIVEWSSNNAFLNPARHVEGIGALIWTLREHPLHGRHESQIGRLSAAIKAIDLGRKADPVAAQESMLDEALRSAFGEFIRFSSAPDRRAAEQQAVRA